MESEWQTQTIGEIAEKVGMGPFGSSIKVETFVSEGSIPIISGKHLHGSRVDDAPGFNFITQEHAQRLANAKVMCGDIVLTHRGTIGQVAYIPENSQFDHYVVSQSQFYVRCDCSKVIPEFVALYLVSPEGQHKLLANTSQVGVPAIAQPVTYLRTIGIPLPSLDEQRAIANVFGALDDKIEQNRHTAQALERLARAIFRAWFVDFEPVKAKAAGSASFPSMPQHVFDALPTNFVESEIGLVPEGWEVKDLNKCVHLTMGQSPPSEFYNERGEGLPFHQGVRDYGFRFPSRRVYCTVEGRIAEPQDVLLSVRAPVGRINVADRRLVLGRGLAGLRHRSDRQAYLLQQIFHVFAEEDSVGEGTIYKAVTKRFLEQLPLLSPPEQVQDEFDELIRPLDQLIVECEVESGKLAKMRDLLLPRLMSGNVKVDFSHSKSSGGCVN